MPKRKPAKKPRKPKPVKLGSPEFRRLQARWYEKLAASGFEDIEEPNDPQEKLKRWDSFWFATRRSVERNEAQAHYFLQATHALHNYRFERQLDKDVWQRHCDGAFPREIAAELGCSKSLVHNIITRIRKDIFGK